MKSVIKDTVLVIVPETPEDAVQVSAWKIEHAGAVLALTPQPGDGLVLSTLGSREEVCREPINITSQIKDPVFRLIGNFAPTPFVLDGIEYGCIESFWQGLKFDDVRTRRDMAAMPAGESRGRGDRQGYPAIIRYFGAEIVPGTFDHWTLMRRACRAKFTQHLEARAALLATGTRPLTHKMRSDSRTIPGVIMSSIWMEHRDALRDDESVVPFLGGAIDRFDDSYRWLSNFWPAEVTFDGVNYPTVEHAYQAAKTLVPAERQAMLACATAGDAKRLADTVTRRDDWADAKLGVMEGLLRQKFREGTLRKRLIETAPLEIIEGNFWNDTYWGVCNGQGQNNLGRLLIKIRAEAMQ